MGYGARRDPSKDGGKIGPEYLFGLTVAKAHKGPVLLIKCAWGGKSLHTDFRPPSAGTFEFSAEQLARFEKQGKDVEKIQADKAAATGRYYRYMIEHVKRVLADPGRVVPKYSKRRGYELAGCVWFQGWNDMVDRGVYPQRDKPGGYASYSENMAHFIRDVRKELKRAQAALRDRRHGCRRADQPGGCEEACGARQLPRRDGAAGFAAGVRGQCRSRADGALLGLRAREDRRQARQGP